MIYQNRIYQNRGYWIASDRCHSYCSHQIQRVHFLFFVLTVFAFAANGLNGSSGFLRRSRTTYPVR